MSKHFSRELETLQHRLLTLFGVVEKMISDASRALVDREIELADEVISRDDHVNNEDVEIEEECLKILALHQPVASDLRQVSTMLKINSDLERIADLACNLAERAQCLHQYPYFPIPDQLPEMARLSTEMVRKALNSFVNLDLGLAEDVILMDPKVDQLNREVIAEMKNMMAESNELIESALHCFSAARHLERIGDHAENIAEDVIYLISGDIIRHQHGGFIESNAENATQSGE